MNDQPAPLPPLLLETTYQPRVWGGLRMGDGSQPIGEAWGAFENNRITGGPLDGMTLAEACRQFGEQILGSPVIARHGRRFPILTKLLDTREWLSVQIHPNDEQARRLEGPDQVGKTEAWHLLETTPDAEIILGLRPGIDAGQFAEAVRGGKTLDVIARQQAVAGDTWFIPAGTVHALGPGIFLYEVQQASDITYRLYDWDRPASAGRELHLDQAIECVMPSAGDRIESSSILAGVSERLVSSRYFTLDRLYLNPGTSATLDTTYATFQALTSTGAPVQIQSAAGDIQIPAFGTALVPASVGSYSVASREAVSVMVSAAALN